MTWETKLNDTVNKMSRFINIAQSEKEKTEATEDLSRCIVQLVEDEMRKLAQFAYSRGMEAQAAMIATPRFGSDRVYEEWRK